MEGTRALVCLWLPADTNLLKIGTQLSWVGKSSICRALAFKKLGDGVHVWAFPQLCNLLRLRRVHPADAVACDHLALMSRVAKNVTIYVMLRKRCGTVV